LENKTSKAVFYIIMSGLAFALMTVMVKLSDPVHISIKLVSRNLVALLVVGLSMIGKRISYFGQWRNQPYLIGRSVFGAAGMTLVFYAVSHMNLADAYMLHSLSPFTVAVLAALFLGERMTRFQLFGLVIIFFASLLIIKPKFDLSVIPALAAAGSALTSGVAYTALRFLGTKEHPATIVFYFSFFSTLVFLPIAIYVWQQPTAEQYIYLVATGIFAAIGQISMTLAYKYAKATDIVSFTYLNIVFAGIFGFLFWGEVPDIYSIIGGIIIIFVPTITTIYRFKKQQ